MENGFHKQLFGFSKKDVIAYISDREKLHRKEIDFEKNRADELEVKLSESEKIAREAQSAKELALMELERTKGELSAETELKKVAISEKERLAKELAEKNTKISELEQRLSEKPKLIAVKKIREEIPEENADSAPEKTGTAEVTAQTDQTEKIGESFGEKAIRKVSALFDALRKR